MPSEVAEHSQYSSTTGLIYVFNLIVGTGALTLPAALGRAGTVLGLVIILILAFMSFLTVTFVIEAMSIANSVILKTKHKKKDDESINHNVRHSRRERDPLIPPNLTNSNEEDYEIMPIAASYEIKERVEMGRMATMFFSKMGLYSFYLCITIYLYGDLAIYITAVAKSLRDTCCTYIPTTNASLDTNSSIIPDSEICWTESIGIDRFTAYRIFSTAFVILLGPFVFFNVQKTKHLQIATSLMRWIAFIIMITLALTRIINGQGTGRPIKANFYELPNLFGVCVYSFMCHHSLPSLITPISNKKRLFSLFFLDYSVISTFYLVLAFSGIYAFDEIKDLYTLNFEPDRSESPGLFFLLIQYFLSLFPVFTLSTNFPIIAITLRNNLKALFQINEEEEDIEFSLEEDSITSINLSAQNTPCIKYCRNLGFPLMSIIPPFLVAIFVEDVQILVSITGSYAGSGIQYMIPVFLVYYARQCSSSVYIKNPFSSPFKHNAWLIFVVVWGLLCMIFVTVNHFLPKPNSNTIE